MSVEQQTFTVQDMHKALLGSGLNATLLERLHCEENTEGERLAELGDPDKQIIISDYDLFNAISNYVTEPTGDGRCKPKSDLKSEDVWTYLLSQINLDDEAKKVVADFKITEFTDGYQWLWFDGTFNGEKMQIELPIYNGVGC